MVGWQVNGDLSLFVSFDYAVFVRVYWFAVRWGDLRFITSFLEVIRALAHSHTHLHTDHNSHISENRTVNRFPSDMLVCFGTKQSCVHSQSTQRKRRTRRIRRIRRRTMFWKQSGVISVYVTPAWETSEDPCFIWFNSRWWEHALCQSARAFKAFAVTLVPNRSCWRRLTVCRD